MLRLDGVCKHYGERDVLRGVTLAARPGSVTLLAGPNGAGKSTLLHIMAGLLRPDAGTVAHAAPPGGVGYLGHSSLIYPGLTALENLEFWCRLHGVPSDEDILMMRLARMGLAAFADEKAGVFSRGMTQRLSLARLFLLRPVLVLLDEPGTGLDAASLACLRAELAASKDNGAALVWVTHGLADDLEAADQIVLLQDGRARVFTKDAFDLAAWRQETITEAAS